VSGRTYRSPLPPPPKSSSRSWGVTPTARHATHATRPPATVRPPTTGNGGFHSAPSRPLALVLVPPLSSPLSEPSWPSLLLLLLLLSSQSLPSEPLLPLSALLLLLAVSTC
jgi:hypothetical protein